MPPAASPHQALIQWMIADKLPFHLVSSVGFKAFVRSINPDYQLPSRSTLASTSLDAEYSNAVNHISRICESFDNIALTTDGWTGLKTSFWSITLHGIDKNYNLLDLRLGCFPIYAKTHDAVTLANMISSKLSEASVAVDKVVAVVTDQGGAAPAIAQHIGNAQELHCAAHLLNTALKRSFEYSISKHPFIGVVLTCCKTLAASFNQSTQFREQIIANQLATNEPLRSLKQDVITRWNSRLLNLKSIADARQAITLHVSQYPDDPHHGLITRCSKKFWEMIGHLINVLEPYEDATKTLSADKEPTLHLVIPEYLAIIDFLRNYCLNATIDDSLSPMIRHLVKSQIRCLSNKMKPWLPAERMAFALSPFHRKGSSIPGWDDLLQEGYDELRNELSKLENSILASQSSSLDEIMTNQVQATEPIRSYAQYKSKITGYNTSSSGLIDELGMFIQLKSPKPCSVLAWWKSNSETFPRLSCLVRKYLCIPASQTSSEREFSQMRLICSDLRSGLDTKKAGKLSTVGALLRSRNMAFDVKKKRTQYSIQADEQRVTGTQNTRRQSMAVRFSSIPADSTEASEDSQNLEVDGLDGDDIADGNIFDFIGDGERSSDGDFSEPESDGDSSDEPESDASDSEELEAPKAKRPKLAETQVSKSTDIICNLFQTDGTGHRYHAVFSNLEGTAPGPDKLFGSNTRYITGWKQMLQDRSQLTFVFVASSEGKNKYRSGKELLRVLGPEIRLSP